MNSSDTILNEKKHVNVNLKCINCYKAKRERHKVAKKLYTSEDRTPIFLLRKPSSYLSTEDRRKTRRERLKSAPYLRLKKLKFFEIVKGGPFRDIKKIFEKKTKNRKIRILSQSHSAEKLERGDPLGFLKLQFAVKYQKT